METFLSLVEPDEKTCGTVGAGTLVLNYAKGWAGRLGWPRTFIDERIKRA
jgi:hypothetical protein